MSNFNFITLCDGYKLDHRRQYPQGTEYVYSNFTPRSSRISEIDEVVFFGLQYFLQEYLTDLANETFFHQPKSAVLAAYQSRINGYIGPNEIGVEHIAALHDLGYIPLRFCALPEGTLTPLRCPMFTFENTLPEFFWVTNYIETILSNVLWMPCTSATTALRYRKLLDQFAEFTGGNSEFVQWQGHDFSFRGMAGTESAALSGAAHLLSFTGTDSIPAIELLEKYYDATGLIGGSVAATEHSVMCAGGKESEIETFRRLLKLYPTGIISVVSDTWDLWHVVDNILPALKDEIMARDGKLVIRPDSGDPADILCGTLRAKDNSLARKGLIKSLWDIFGGTTNDQGYKVLNGHIGAIYGDSITPERCEDICDRLQLKGFASTNVVFGIGSYTYQYVTRDTFGFAIKATWAQINGKEHELFKDPKTDDGVKRSARGRLSVVEYNGKLCLIDKGDLKSQSAVGSLVNNLLQPVWQDGKFLIRTNLDEIRHRLNKK